MARIEIADLPVLEELTEEEMASLLGGSGSGAVTPHGSGGSEGSELTNGNQTNPGGDSTTSGGGSTFVQISF